MWAEQIVLGLIGLSSGVAVAGGLFAFIVELGVVADLADRTHTAENLCCMRILSHLAEF